MSATENRDNISAAALEDTSLDSLVRRLRDLTLRVQELESALQVANKKIAFYEGYDELIQDAMAYSLRIAFEIRSKAELQAKEIVEKAHREEEGLRAEVQRLSTEREAMLAERDALRKESEVHKLSAERDALLAEREALRQAVEVRKLAAEREELLAERESLEKDIEEVRRVPPAVAKPVETVHPELARLRAERDALLSERDILRETVTAKQQEAVKRMPERPAPRPRTEEREDPAGEPATGHRQLLDEVAALERRLRSIKGNLDAPSAPPITQPPRVAETFVPREMPGVPVRGEDVFDLAEPIVPTLADLTVDLAPPTLVPEMEMVDPIAEHLPQPIATPVGAGAGAIREAAREARPSMAEQAMPEVIEGEVELVVSPVQSFPKLVELERALLSLPEVKSSYVRNLQYGVATLLIKLVAPQKRDEILAKLEYLPGWNLAILSCPPHRIEAKIGAS